MRVPTQFKRETKIRQLWGIQDLKQMNTERERQLKTVSFNISIYYIDRQIDREADRQIDR